MYRKVTDGLTEREVDGELVILLDETGEIHQLNQVAACIWRSITADTTVDILEKIVSEQFEVDGNTAHADVDHFLTTLKTLKLIEMV